VLTFELKRLHVLKKLQKSFGISGKRSTFASAIGKTTLVTPKANANAEIAQLVEHNLAPRNWKMESTLARKWV